MRRCLPARLNQVKSTVQWDGEGPKEIIFIGEAIRAVLTWVVGIVGKEAISEEIVFMMSVFFIMCAVPFPEGLIFTIIKYTFKLVIRTAWHRPDFNQVLF
jgi:hypothetical protein